MADVTGIVSGIVTGVIVGGFTSYITYVFASKTKDKDRGLDMIKSFNGVIEYLDPSNNKVSKTDPILSILPNSIEARERIVKFKADFGHIFNKETEKMLSEVVSKVNEHDTRFFTIQQKEIHIDLIKIRDKMKKDYDL